MPNLLKQIFRPSFPKAALIAAVACSFILWKFRVPERKVAPSRPTVQARKTVSKRVPLNPAPVMGGKTVVSPPSAPAVPKVAEVKKPVRRKAKKVVRTAAMKKLLLAAARVEPEFDWPEVDESQLAVNLANPLETLAIEALATAPVEDDSSSLNLVSLGEEKAEAEPVVVDRRLQVVIGEVVQNDFAPIRERITSQKEEFQEVTEIIEVETTPSPAPTLEPELVRPEPKLVKATPKPKAKPKAEKKVTSAVVPVPIVVKKEAPEAQDVVTAALSNLSPSLASMAPSVSPTKTTQPSTPPSAIQAVPEQWVTNSDKNVLVIPTPGKAPLETGKISVSAIKKEESKPTRDTGIEERILGRLELSEWVLDWLEERNAFAEVSLFADGGTSGTILVDYNYPDEDFRLEPRGLHGRYWLQATFYQRSGQPNALARVIHSKPISFENQTQFVHFKVDRKLFESSLQSSEVSPSRSVAFTGILYKVDTGKHSAVGTSLKPNGAKVSSGEISFLGFPEWKRGFVNADGSVKAKLPASSELLAKITSPGFYPTYRIIPTFAGPLHHYIFMAHEEELDPVIRYFTGRAQLKPDVLSPGLIFGRVFDSVSHNPSTLVPISLSHPITADQLLPATTESGFFGFSNVVPSMRAVSRGDRQPRFLINVHEGSAQYVEFGLGEKKDVLGKLVGMEGEEVAPAKVRLAGDKVSETWTDDSQQFRVEGIDFPAGLITLEVDAPGFPLTWYNLSWDPEQPEKSREVALVSNVALAREHTQHPRLPKPDSFLGHLIGSLEASFWEKNRCVFVHLLDSQGGEVSTDHGPFPFSAGERDEMDPYCLPANGQSAGQYAYYNLKDGEYILKVQDPKGKLLRTHVLRIGNRRYTITKN